MSMQRKREVLFLVATAATVAQMIVIATAGQAKLAWTEFQLDEYQVSGTLWGAYSRADGASSSAILYSSDACDLEFCAGCDIAGKVALLLAAVSLACQIGVLFILYDLVVTIIAPPTYSAHIERYASLLFYGAAIPALGACLAWSSYCERTIVAEVASSWNTGLGWTIQFIIGAWWSLCCVVEFIMPSPKEDVMPAFVHSASGADQAV